MTKSKRFRSLSEIEKFHSSEVARHASSFDRDPSFEYRYRKMREFSSKPFKFDAKSPEAGNHFDDYDSSASAQACTLSKKTRDFIGENLLDIENTLKALNLDFLQTFNELEKNDSAETLFGENYSYESNINPKIISTALKLTKFPQNYGSVDASPKSAKSSQFSPLEKHMGPTNTNGMQYLNDSSSTDKLLDGKRSSTPDTGFASRETNTSSRRGSQKSSYSPQESHYSPSYTSQVEEARAAYAHLKANGSFPSRQRSMSFTENYELKSPVLSEPPSAKRNVSGNVGSTNASINHSGDGQPMLRSHQRNSIVYKPKSIKARNMRRLSYNPIVFDSSSSSCSEPEVNHHSIAQSECDIRSKLFTNGRHHRTQNAQYLNRKSTQYQSNNSNSFVPHHDKLYGSNASIKSAPQYNNFASDRQLHHYLDQKFNLQSYARAMDEQPPTIPTNNIGNFDRNARGSSRRRQLSRNYILPPPPPPPPSANRTFDAPPTINFMNYNQFDVSKLTGKSPTTQSFLQELFPDAKATTATPTASVRINAAALQQTPPLSSSANASAFHWPEKIHISAVAPNTSLWPQKQTKSPAMKPKSTLGRAASLQQITSDSSSSTETDVQTKEFVPRIPPSPAP